MSVKGVDFDPFKPFDFEGVELFGISELVRNFSEPLGNFWGTLREPAGRETRPLQYLAKILLISRDIYSEYYPKLKTAALSAVRKGLGDL